MAHDFNNILLAIGGYASLARLKQGALHPDLDKKMRGILEAVERAKSLTAHTVRQEKVNLHVNPTVTPDVLALSRAVARERMADRNDCRVFCFSA